MMLSNKKDDRSLHASWLSAVLLLAPLALFGELLITKTHHRPLGAATFATAALVSWAVTEQLCRRVLDPEVSQSRARVRRGVWVVSGVTAVAVLVRALL